MRLLAFKDLKPEKGITYSKPHIYRLEQAGQFPMHVKLGPGRNGWIEDEIDDWVKAKIAKRDANVAAASVAVEAAGLSGDPRCPARKRRGSSRRCGPAPEPIVDGYWDGPA